MLIGDSSVVCTKGKGETQQRKGRKAMAGISEGFMVEILPGREVGTRYEVHYGDRQKLLSRQ